MKTPSWLLLFACLYVALMIVATPKVYRLTIPSVPLPETETRIACLFVKPVIDAKINNVSASDFYRFETLSASWLVAYAAFSLCGGILLSAGWARIFGMLQSLVGRFHRSRYVLGLDLGGDRDCWVKSRIRADGNIEIIDHGVNEHKTANVVLSPKRLWPNGP